MISVLRVVPSSSSASSSVSVSAPVDIFLSAVRWSFTSVSSGLRVVGDVIRLVGEVGSPDGEGTVSVVEVIEEDGVAVLEIVTVTGSDLTTEGGAGSDFGASRETPGRDIPGTPLILASKIVFTFVSCGP